MHLFEASHPLYKRAKWIFIQKKHIRSLCWLIQTWTLVWSKIRNFRFFQSFQLNKKDRSLFTTVSQLFSSILPTVFYIYIYVYYSFIFNWSVINSYSCSYNVILGKSGGKNNDVTWKTSNTRLTRKDMISIYHYTKFLFKLYFLNFSLLIILIDCAILCEIVDSNSFNSDSVVNG